MITIVDYGMGNIHSVQKALESLGAQTKVVNKPDDLKECSKIVLPGVGAFEDAMSALKVQGLIAPLKENINKGRIFLGICLGMQLLFEKSEEAKNTAGLGILRGSVKKFEGRLGIKVPHMGWNQLKITAVNCPILKGLTDGDFVYFCHSYYPDPHDKKTVAATCNYGNDFASIIWRENIYGAQFHPEKSQDIGLRILKNFVELC